VLGFLCCFAVFSASLAGDSCTNRCDTSADSNYDCQCNTLCISKYDDCCEDYEELCTPYSCDGRCGQDYQYNALCQCNEECNDYDNCCPDYGTICPAGATTTTTPASTTSAPSNDRTSCSGICGAQYDNSEACQCNDQCSQYGNCCSDYVSECTTSSQDTCAGRCGETMDPSQSCQCNDECTSFGDCCNDYNSLCSSSGGGTGGTGGSSDEIETIAQQLWDLDQPNRVQNFDYIINEQAKVNKGSDDQSPKPFFTFVNEVVLYEPSFKIFTPLLDNYEKYQGIGETFPPNELAETDAFLDYFLASGVGQALYTFLDSKGKAGNSLDEFKEMMRTMWFECYSRKNGQLDTSGFEHVFVGEISSNDVGGFHNWVQFYFQEKQGALNYYGYLSKQQPELWGMTFEWDGYDKPIDGFPVGSTPEYELAVLTLCFVMEPNKACGIQMDGIKQQIQTYKWTNSYPDMSGVYYVASAYFLT